MIHMLHKRIDSITLKMLAGEKIDGIQGTIKFLEMEDEEQFLNLQSTIVNHLPDKSLFVAERDDFYKNFIKNDGKIIGCFVDNVLISYVIILEPKLNKVNLGYDLGFADEQLLQVAHLESIVVHPTYRGNSLQVILSKIAIKLTRDWGYLYFLCTVSPTNSYSLKNLLSVGFQIKKEKVKYGGSNRLILQLNL